jgi:hypothetical protein
VRAIIANHDDRAHTAHYIAAETDTEQLPDRVASLLARRTVAVQARRTAYRQWNEAAQELLERQRWIDQHLSRSQDQGLDHGIDL